MNPVPIVVIIIGTLSFTAILYGDELGPGVPTLPDKPEAAAPDGTCTGWFDGFVCAIGKAIEFVADTFTFVYQAILFLFAVITFDVPGAPGYVRAVVGTAVIGTLTWVIVGVVRGVES